ncbi:integrase-like protein [Alkalibaculum bacchi]|uniref:Integrase-like protein n=1 Tax=Alkalibaculum bacchi TaxID=645887 RepID=A0A366HW84_9FIRM|nr:integrase-like protein [Alkalibaculum bacchi]
MSAILDLGDKSIFSFVIGKSNNNDLVFKTFDIAHSQYPDTKPIFHSDREVQYTTKAFKKKLGQAEMTQSMSRVSRCIDNGPMEVASLTSPLMDALGLGYILPTIKTSTH